MIKEERKTSDYIIQNRGSFQGRKKGVRSGMKNSVDYLWGVQVADRYPRLIAVS